MKILTVLLLCSCFLDAQPGIYVTMNADSTYTVDVYKDTGAKPLELTRYSPLSEKEAITVIATWTELQSRKRSASQYDLILAKITEERARNDAQAVGVLDIETLLSTQAIRTYAGKWTFHVPGKQQREMQILEDGTIMGLEQEGQAIATNLYEVEVQSGGAKLRFYSNDGNTFICYFNKELYKLSRIK